METNEHTNPTEQNVSLADFRIVGFREIVHSNGDGTYKAGGSCDYCGTGIRWAVLAEHVDGLGAYFSGRTTWTIGTDCAEKIGVPKSELRNMRRRFDANTPEAKARRAANAEREAARQAKIDARLAAEAEAARLAPWAPELVVVVDALFDLVTGALVTANLRSTRYGLSWYGDDCGFVNAHPKRVSTMAKKGYYEGRILVEQRSGRNGSYIPKDDKYQPERIVAILDNGQFEEMKDTRPEYGSMPGDEYDALAPAWLVGELPFKVW